MSDVGAPDPFDPRPAEGSTPDAEWAALDGGQSRRRFLRKALIGSAAAAAAAGTASTLIATAAGASPANVLPRIARRLSPSRSQVSPMDASSLCVEISALPGSSATCFNVNNGHASPGDFWLFFTVRSVAPGDYLAKVTQSTDGGVTPVLFTTSSVPFELDNDHAVHVTIGGTPANCPTTNPAGTSSADDPVAVHVATSTQDVQVALHIKWNGGQPSGPETVTFNAKLTDTGGSHIFASPAAVSLVTPCPTP